MNMSVTFNIFHLFQSLLDVSKYNSSFPRILNRASTRGKVELYFETLRKLREKFWNNGLNSNWSSRQMRRRVNNRLPWQQVPWESGLRWNIALTLALIPLGIEMRCKWGGQDEFIQFIPVFQNGIIIWPLYFPFSVLLFFFSDLHVLVSLSFHRWSSGAFSPGDPAPWKGRVDSSASSAPEFFSGAPPQWSLPFWGPLVLAQILPEEERHSPERVLARNHARVDQVSFRLTASSVRSSGQSSFPFLERTSTVSPPECKRFPPTGETHGALAGQDSVPQVMSQGRAWSMKILRDWTGSYNFRHHDPCGTKE